MGVHRRPPVVLGTEPVQAGPPQDPVKLAVLAMDSLGRASMRASFTGVEVKVAVPDGDRSDLPCRAVGDCA